MIPKSTWSGDGKQSGNVKGMICIPMIRKRGMTMIVYNDNDKKKQIEKTEEEQKEEMLDELRKESLSTICLACLYAKKYEETGMDITERWATAEQQSEIIQSFYYQGYDKGFADGIEMGKRIEREEARQMQQDIYRRDDQFFEGDMSPAQIMNIVKHQWKKSPTKKKRRR